MPRLKARLFSAPCRSRLISELKQACRGQHLSSPTDCDSLSLSLSLIFLFFLSVQQPRHDEETRTSSSNSHKFASFPLLLYFCVPILFNRKSIVSVSTATDDESTAEETEYLAGFNEKSRWMTIVERDPRIRTNFLWAFALSNSGMRLMATC